MRPDSRRARSDDLRRQLDERDAEFAAVLHRWKAERADESYLARIVRRSCDAIGIGVGPDELADAIMALAEENDALRKARTEPDAVSVEAVMAIIQKHCAGLAIVYPHEEAAREIAARYGAPPTVPAPDAVSVEAVEEILSVEGSDPWNKQWCRDAAKRIVARYGSPPTVLALPSVEEVARVITCALWGFEGERVSLSIARDVLDLVRERQPAATRECAESAKQLRSWLTNPEPFPDDETIEAMWGLVNVLDPDGDDEAQPGAKGGA